jgi:hypothetical protein
MNCLSRTNFLTAAYYVPNFLIYKRNQYLISVAVINGARKGPPLYSRRVSGQPGGSQ